MRVVYRKSIVERLLEVIAEAESQNRTIDYIELSQSEWKELRASGCLPYSNPGMFCGVPLQLNNAEL